MKKNIILIVLVIMIYVVAGCSGNSPKVPDGFSHTKGTVEEGYVIADEEGNEFVWVPVEKLVRYDFENTTEVQDEAIGRIFYGEGRKEAVTHETEQDISKFKESVEKYGGFYIARYESGREADKLVSKKDCKPYTFVTRNEALITSNDFYKGNNAGSTLINSYAWDSAILFAYDDAKDYNHKGEKKHICNLADSVSEWTTEYSSNAYYDYHDDCVMRGASDEDKEPDPTLRKCNSDSKSDLTGFRMVIYLLP